MSITRRGLQLTLAGLWLVDAALQFQPYMFSSGFAQDVVRPAGDGQPAAVASSVHVAASVIAANPVLTNAVFALIQLALAFGLLVRRSARLTLLASVIWSACVWWFGEGAGGLFSGHSMLLTGAPGAVLLYVLVAFAALPERGGDGRGESPRGVAVGAWVAVWMLGAALQLLPGQNSSADLAGAVRDTADDAPHVLAAPIAHLADALGRHSVFLVALVGLQFLIGVLALRPGLLRVVSVSAGIALAVGFWVFGQAVGELTTGQSTDPNSAPLLVVLGLAAVAARAAARQRPSAVSASLPTRAAVREAAVAL